LLPIFNSERDDCDVVYPCCTNVSTTGDNDTCAYVGSIITGNTRSADTNHFSSADTLNAED